MDYYAISDPWISQSVFNFVSYKYKNMYFNFQHGWDVYWNRYIKYEIKHDEDGNYNIIYEYNRSNDLLNKSFMNILCKVSNSFCYYRLSSDYVLYNIVSLDIYYNVSYNMNYNYDKINNIFHYLIYIMKKIPNIPQIMLHGIRESGRYYTLDDINYLFLTLQNNTKLYMLSDEYLSLFNDENFITEQLLFVNKNIRFYHLWHCKHKSFYHDKNNILISNGFTFNKPYINKK